MEKISILLPTRNRPNFVDELISTCYNTADNPENIEFIFYTDKDDTATHDYFKNTSNPLIKYIIGDRIVLSEMWNKCYEIASGDILMHCGDDIRFRTNGWDTVIRNKFNEYNDKIAFVFGYDGIQSPGGFGTHGFIHRNWVNTVGYFVPPYFSSDYNDTWLNDVARMINRWFFVDVYTEHIHPAAGKYHMDQTHQDRMVRHYADNVEGIYNDKYNERVEDSNKLLKYIEEYGRNN